MADETRSRRLQTASDRIPDEVFDTVTGVVDDPDVRAEARNKRPTDQRVARLEVRADSYDKALSQVVTEQLALTRTMTEMARDVGEAMGQLKVLPSVVEGLKDAVARLAAKQDHDDALKGEDALDAAKHRRARVTQVVGWVFGTGGGLVLLLKLLGVL